MKKKVLIIDDDIDICKKIKYALQSEATDAYYALSVSDAIEKITRMVIFFVVFKIIFPEGEKGQSVS